MKFDKNTALSQASAAALVDSIFISHSSGDKYFVNLLVAILEYHGIDPWYSQTSIRAGESFRAEIKEAIANSEAMLVVISKNSAKSKWVTKEIVLFQATRPDAPLVPLVLEKLPVEEIPDELREYQWIDFTENMLDGFQQLVAFFNRSFLPDPRTAMRERRDMERRARDRRERKNRRVPIDRRKSSLIQRMRIGFWKACERATRMGEFDLVHFNVRSKFKISDALREEVATYTFRDASGTALDSVELLEHTVDQIWKELGARGSIKAVYLTEAIAEDLAHNYQVSIADRRSDERRSVERRNNERRELN